MKAVSFPVLDPPVPPCVLEDMARRGIDIDLALEMLANRRSGFYTKTSALPVARGIPSMDDESVMDLRRGERLSGRKPLAVELRAEVAVLDRRLEKLGFSDADRKRYLVSPETENRPFITIDSLTEIGTRLLPRTAFGVLNGGSATSYADRKRNRSLGEGIFEAVRSQFELLSETNRDVPKGVAPAYLNPDGTPGESFLALKLRARLLQLKASRAYSLPGGSPAPQDQYPLVQMTSQATDSPLAAHYWALEKSPLLAPLARSLGMAPTAWHTGIQPLIPAFSHSSKPGPVEIFDSAYGETCRTLPLPGGHGQCFRALRSILEQLYARGIRFFTLGNVDNLGYLPDPVEIALLALSGKPAGFDFSARSPLDIKGGILIETKTGNRTVADIGPAIPFSEVLKLEAAGQPALFNCASGIFDLEWLVPRIAEIAEELPVRISDQDKDAGRYSQAEQVTWEVMGLLPSFLAFVVDKDRRFLAAKLLVETLLTSGLGLSDSRIPEEVRDVSRRLSEGLSVLLREKYGMALVSGRWEPSDRDP